jgi:KDO2-lipid IV(A) lauroyltransferase
MARPRVKRRSSVGWFFYHFRYRLGEYALRGLVRVLPAVPYLVLTRFTMFLAWVTFGLLFHYRRRMEHNVGIALGEITTRAQRKELIWRAWKNFARGILETSAVMHFPKARIVKFIAIQGEENLVAALKKNKGVIALSAHLGGFTLIGARLAAAGYAFSVVVKQPGDKRFASLIDGYRSRVGIQTISARPRREAVRGIVKALRQNRIVLVIADEFKSGGLMVNFMGQNIPAPRGPATLALRTGAATVPMFATRRPDGTLLLTVGPEIELIRNEDIEESVAATTKLFTRYLEDAIRRYPDQWNWLGFSRNGVRPQAETPRLDTQERTGMNN